MSSTKHSTALKEYQLKALFCFQSNSSIRADHAAQTRRKYSVSLIHLQFLIELKALQKCILAIYMLKQKSQKQNIKSRSHGSAVVSEERLPRYLFDPQREKRKQRGGMQRELLGFMCFTRRDRAHAAWATWILFTAPTQQSIPLSDFGLTCLRHTQSLFLSFAVWYDWCVSWLKFCHRTFRLISHHDRQMCVHSALQQLFICCHSNSARATVVVLIECEINLAHTLFLCSPLINNAVLRCFDWK